MLISHTSFDRLRIWINMLVALAIQKKTWRKQELWRQHQQSQLYFHDCLGNGKPG